MNRTVAIVGLGPRGLYAAECLTAALNSRDTTEQWELVLFDNSGFPGSGPHYAPDQSSLNLLNIPLREVPLDARTESSGYVNLPAFQSYRDWQSEYTVEDDSGFDVFPSRASIGQYLQARFYSWLGAWQRAEKVRLLHSTIIRVDWTVSGASIVDSENNRYSDLYHVLLTIGHQPAIPDSSLVQWRKLAEHHPPLVLVERPYPTDRLLSDSAFTKRSVALRGMGLSMIDAVKALSEGRGGVFEPSADTQSGLRYIASGDEPRQLLPFSLDGLPMTPKPANESIDRLFQLTTDDVRLLSITFSSVKVFADGEELLDAVIKTIAEISARCCQRLDHRCLSHRSSFDLTSVISRWLHDECVEHEYIVSRDISTAAAMYKFLAMAQGDVPISVDYVVGQVWRHCQKMFYRKLAFLEEGTDVLIPFINLDQRLKRYAFGPPVGSTRRLLALVECGLIKFGIADDPDIITGDCGWILQDDANRSTTDVMINTVLASPDLGDACSPLVKQLNKDRLLNPASSDNFGALIARDGTVLDAEGNTNKQVAFVGRLAIGSIVEADALMECFGPQLEDWASSLVSRAAGL